MSVCKRHEKQVRELSTYNKKSVRRRTLGDTLPDIPFSDHQPSTTESAFQPVTVSTGSTEERAEATFVSYVSSDASLASKAIKANTTVCGATKLVDLLTTSTSVSAFNVNAIITAKFDKLYDAQSNDLTNQLDRSSAIGRYIGQQSHDVAE